MQTPIISYDYWETKDDEGQYGDIDFSNIIGGVPARYVKRESDKGNPYIEALPRPRTQLELGLACYKGIAGYDRTAELEKTRLDKMLSILRLRDIRYPLPMSFELEEDVYAALVMSYRARRVFRDPGGDISLSYEARNTTCRTDGLLIGNDAAAANAGITMLGYSGCGKSSALEMLFSNYPQYIVHKGEGLTRYPQIVYLVVQCPPHSNFRGLYKNIGVAIDRALGNVIPVYAKELDPGERGNLARYNDKVRELIEKFAIGIIIFDEVQHLHFDASLENSFESILELCNQTKVAFGIVGTEDAYSKIFAGNLRQSRRLGPEIHADRYCKDKGLFTNLVLKLFQYQWFDSLVAPTEELVNALYNCTKGIIDQLIGLFMFMNLDYMNATRKPTIDANYVYKVSDRHYPGVRALLDEIDEAEAERARAELAKQGAQEMMDLIDVEKQKRAEAASKNVLGDVTFEQAVKAKQHVVSLIKDVDDTYSSLEIEKVCDRVLTTKEGQALLKAQKLTRLTQIVNAKLKEQNSGTTSTKTTKSRNKSKVAPETMKSFLMGDSDKN